ncbi:flavodoxin, long chain [Beggiatoa alba B18LD]|uniref:Flavodoxin n=1 Tax=Beggiatoa alba B18LD TaxID=395493 RepID=I3CFW2_9GAMM|nr:flavodoxin [Beggiatoa alba]EIJ42505.1 flavodoxin, long chain [Beggiatoa alba B18LD]
MGTIGLFYGTDTGNTRKVAKTIAKKFGEGVVDIHNVAKATAEDLAKYNSLILGTPTLGDGELEPTWEEFLPKLDEVDLTGKVVAVYGLGDQDGYGHEFVDAMIILYKKAKERGAKLVGSWPTDGYDFTKSKSVVNDEFVGLALDQDNQADMTDERVSEWIEKIRADLGA